MTKPVSSTTPSDQPIPATPPGPGPEPMALTHVDETGAARMVDVSAKAMTARRAVAGGRVRHHRRGDRPAAPATGCRRATRSPSPGSPASWAPSAPRTWCRSATRSRCTASPSTSIVADDGGGDHRHRQDGRPHRRRDGGADGGRRPPDSTLIDMIKAVDPAASIERGPGAAQGGRQDRRLGPPRRDRPMTASDRHRATSARVIVASNRAAAGVYADTSGPLLVAGLRELGCDVDDPVVVPDGDPVGHEPLRAAVADGLDVGRDQRRDRRHPDRPHPGRHPGILDYEIPGIAEAIRAHSRRPVPTAALSRGLAGVAGRTLVVNLPGSTGGARDGLAVLGPILVHTVDQMHGGDHCRAVCARARGSREPTTPIDWRPNRARHVVRTTRAAAAAGSTRRVPLADADGHTLAEPLVTRTDLPAFPTSSVDGWAVRGTGAVAVRSAGSWPGSSPAPLPPTAPASRSPPARWCPDGTAAVIRVEESTRTPTAWSAGEPAPGTGVARSRRGGRRGGGAAARRHPGRPGRDRPGRLLWLRRRCRSRPRPPPRCWSSATSCSPPGRRRRSGTRRARHRWCPRWLRRYGATRRPGRPSSARYATPSTRTWTRCGPRSPLPTWSAPPAAPCTARSTTCTRRWRELGADYVVNTVAVRPGFPMLLARIPGPDGRPRFVAGLPGNPQSADRRAGLAGRPAAGRAARARPDAVLPTYGSPSRCPVGATYTHLALVRLDPVDGPPRIRCRTSARRCCAGWPADGFAVIRPGHGGRRRVGRRRCRSCPAMPAAR